MILAAAVPVSESGPRPESGGTLAPDLLLWLPLENGFKDFSPRHHATTVHGDVVSISARATTVVTNENIAIIVPNADFISSKVTNWSYTDRKVRFDVPVGVSYQSDPEVVTRLLLEVATAHKGVLATPRSEVLFDEFGDSSLNFSLQVWTKDYSAKPRVLKSELNYAIASIFKKNDIEIPFPQRDLHIRSGALSKTALD